MPTNTLTDAKCKGAKPAEKDYKLFDGGGLFLFVTTKGGKIWRLAYRVDGKPKTISFGPYPAVSLSEARMKRDEAKAKLRDGSDPMEERKAPARTSKTLGEASDLYWSGRKDLSSSYIANATRGINMHLSKLLSKDIGKITRLDLLTELQHLDAAGKHVYVRKIRMWVSQVFDWAIENELAEINPASQIKPEKAFGKAQVEHFAALEIKEVPDFLFRLSMEDDLQSVMACRLLAYTWVRTNELRMMEWPEIDLDEKVWLIPAGKMKRKKDHLVPLSEQAIEIIQSMKDRSRGGRYVFESDRNKDRPISENSILYLIHRIGYKGKMTGHGWRSVASTWANENGYSPDAIERQLAHVPDNKIRAVYNRAEYLPERQKMIQDWANWLDSCNANADRQQG